MKNDYLRLGFLDSALEEIEKGRALRRKAQTLKKNKLLKAWYTVAFVTLFCIFCVCLYLLYANLRDERSHAHKMEMIVSVLSPVSPSVPAESSRNSADAMADSSVGSISSVAPSDKESEKLTGYSRLYVENNDLTGFIRVEGTDLSYPVMQTKGDPNYYLNHGFDKEYDSYGLPYIAEYCDVGDTYANVIIYGHNMKNGKMFGTLEKYRSEAFYVEHKTVEFDTLDTLGEYEILGVFTTRIGEGFFPFHEYADLSSSKEFENYTKTVKELSIYDTGVSPIYGRQLITLSTCGGSDELLRIVLVGQKFTDVD